MLLSVCMMIAEKGIFFFMDYFYKNDKKRQKSAEKGFTIENVLTKIHIYCKLIQVAFKTISRGIFYGKDYYRFITPLYT